MILVRVLLLTQKLKREWVTRNFVSMVRHGGKGCSKNRESWTHGVYQYITGKGRPSMETITIYIRFETCDREFKSIHVSSPLNQKEVELINQSIIRLE